MRNGDHAFKLGVMIVELTSDKGLTLYKKLRNGKSNREIENARRYTRKLAENLKVDLDIDEIFQFVNSRTDTDPPLAEWQEQVLSDLSATFDKWIVNCCDLGFEFASYCAIRGGYLQSNEVTKEEPELLEQMLRERAVGVGLDKSFAEELFGVAKDSLVSHEKFLIIASKVFVQIIEYLEQDDNVLHQIIFQGDYVAHDKVEGNKPVYTFGDISNSIVSGVVQGENNEVVSRTNTSYAEITQAPKDLIDTITSSKAISTDQKEDQVKIINQIGEETEQESPHSINSMKLKTAHSLQKSKPEERTPESIDLEDSKMISGRSDLSLRDSSANISNEKAISHKIRKVRDERVQVNLRSPNSGDRDKETARGDSTNQPQPAQNPLEPYKQLLTEVSENLSNVDLRERYSGRIEYYQRSITEVLRAIRRDETFISVYWNSNSKAVFISSLKEASKEIGVALYLSSQLEEESIRIAEKVEGARKFYRNLDKCQECIDQALLQFQF